MKKLLSLLSCGLIKDVGNVIDKLTTTDEERLAAKQKIQELLEKADQDAQTQITERWKLDMQSDSFLSKNIGLYHQPLTPSGLSVIVLMFGSISRKSSVKQTNSYGTVQWRLTMLYRLFTYCELYFVPCFKQTM